MESYGAGLHDRPSLTKEIRLGEQEMLMDAHRSVWARERVP